MGYKMKTIYLSGKMTGLAESVYRENFKKGELFYRACGFEVVNPCNLSEIVLKRKPDATYEDFMAELKGGETLCYSYASVAPKDMNIVENALIFMQKPKLNNDLKDSFNYPNSQFDFEGRCALLKETHFSITSNN